jgi:hypothetical protein
MDPTKGFKVTALEGDAFAAAMGRLFGFAYVWALGGNLAPTCTDAFDEFVREHLQDVVTFPGETACWLVAFSVTITTTWALSVTCWQAWHGLRALLVVVA